MKTFKKLVYPYVGWLLLFVVAPMVLIFLYAITLPNNDVATIKFSLANFIKFFNRDFLRVLLRSFQLALITTIICLIIGYPTAYAITKLQKSYQKIVVLLITMPMWVNMLIKTYAWMGIISNKGILNQLLAIFNLGPIKIMNTNIAVIIGMVYNFLPFMIIQIYGSLNEMDLSIIEAAHDLGANASETFRRVILPLSMPGVLSGITLVFLPSVSSFVIPKLLGGGKSMLIGNLIEDKFINSGDWHFGSAISLILASLVLLSMYFTRKIDVKTGGETNGRF